MKRKKCYIVPHLRTFVAIISIAAIVPSALAARVASPLPPPSLYADTESVTNVTFNAGVSGDNVFSLSLVLDASPSNNVEVAFGNDANGNGALDDSEAAFVVGWDCGEWFFRDIMADMAESCAGACGRTRLDWDVRLDQSLAPKAFRAQAGGAALPFPMMATMYSPSWNVARVTVRGYGNVEAALGFGTFAEPLVIRLR